LLVVVVASCSGRRERENAPLASAPRRDAQAADATPATPAWVTAALMRGGPGLCGWSSTDPRYGVSVFVYRRAADGRLVEGLELSERRKDEPVATTQFRYDDKGRLLQKTVRGADDTSFDVTVDLWYDKAGRVIRRRERRPPTSLSPGEVNTTYTWKGKALPAVRGLYARPSYEDPTEPLAYALAFAGNVHEARFYEGSPAPQPEIEYTHTYDERGRLAEIKSTGYGDSSRNATFEWNADDELVGQKSFYTTTQYEWHDHRVVRARYIDRTGVEQSGHELHYDANGRLHEELLVQPAGKVTEDVTSTTYDQDGGQLVVTTVQNDVPQSRVLRTYHYDCGAAATPLSPAP
jgi:YD repeat-containing protein